MFHILPGNFFVPLSSPNRIVYWDCICRLFSVMEHQLSFGVEREVLVDELQYYFEQSAAADVVDEEFAEADSRGKANGILRKLEFYGWIEIETDKSYVQRVNFMDYAVRLIKTLLEIADGRKVEYQGYIYTIYSLVRANTDHPCNLYRDFFEQFSNSELILQVAKYNTTRICCVFFRLCNQRLNELFQSFSLRNSFAFRASVNAPFS